MKPKKETDWSKSPVIVIMGFVASCIAIIVFITGKESIPEIFSTPTIANNPSSTPISTPNTYTVKSADLIGNDKVIVHEETVNLDGAGQDERLVSWHNLDTFNYSDDKALDVFSFFNGEGWKKVLHLPYVSAPCPNLPEFGVINLFHDQTRQIAIWTGCGTSSLLFLEIHKYRGLGITELIYSNDTSDEKWFESVPYIVDGNLYIFHSDGLYQYAWINDGLVGTKSDINPGTNGVTLEFSFDSACSQISPQEITLAVDQFLFLKYSTEAGEESSMPVRVRYVDNGVLEPRNPMLFFARVPGSTSIDIWGCEVPLANITVVSP